MQININNKSFSAQEGETVLDVAKRNGIYIPTLCYHVKTGQAAKCRACVVAVEGMRGYQTACNLSVREGMNINTEGKEVKEAQRMVVDLMLSSGYHNCLACDRSGSCELQDACYHLGIEKTTFSDHPTGRKDESSEFIVIDYDKCIKCGRCVAACNHSVVNEVLGFGFRGLETTIMCDDDIPMGDSTCVQCGECVQLCPTGALTDKKSRGKGRFLEFEKVDTTCPYCGVGCQLTLHVDRAKNKVVRVTGREVWPNNGMLCVKGRYGFEFHDSPKRLQYPMIKKNGKHERATWDEALDLIAEKIKTTVAKHGPDVFSALGSGRITNENNYAVQKFTRAVIKTNNVDHCARTCHAPTVAGLAHAFGSGAATNSIDEILETDLIFVIGSNMTEAHPVASYYVKRAAQNGSKLIVCDPRRVDIAHWSDLYVPLRVGTDVPFLNGLMNEILKNGWQDEEFMKNNTENPEDIKKWIQDYPVEKASEISGVPVEQMKQVAKMLGEAKKVSVIYCLGITEHTTGTDNVKTIANLQMILGHLGKRGCGVNPLRGQNNVQGACDMGALPNVFHNYQSCMDEKAILKIEKDWGVTGLSRTEGYKLPTMLHKATQGETKILFCVGDNTVQTEPNTAKTIKEVESLEFLVVVDIFPNMTTEYADVILPDVCFNEDDGTYSNLDRRVQFLRKAVDHPGEAKPTWWIMQELGKRLGVDLKFTSANATWEDMRRSGTIMGGITYERIQHLGLQWPCPTVQHPGTPILHMNGKFTRGKGLFSHTNYRTQAELPDKDYPFILSTGRRLWHYHTGTQTRNSVGLENIFPEELLEISPVDAKKMKVKTGDMVKATSRRGTITLKAWVTDRSPEGVTWCAFHFREAHANVLTIDAYDDVTETPEYKACAIKIEKVREGVEVVNRGFRQARP
ncbi:MAG: formate dehydrogenase subunit alpha [Bacteroidetes bacterium]|nr:formate dehydrogenase subunit alpha [Bacteroidota bacterium]